jgi:hypothetical protein
MGLFGSDNDEKSAEEDDDGGILSSTINNAKEGVKISKLQKYLDQDAMMEYTNGEYESPEEYIQEETTFSSWNEFVDKEGETDTDEKSTPSELDEEDYKIVREYLDTDEEPEYILKGSSISIEGGNSEDRKGSLTGMARTAVTQKRVLTVVPQKIMGEDTKSVSYEDMGGIDFNKGLVNKYLKFQSHGRTYKIHTTDAEKTKKALEYIRERKQKLEKEKQSSGGSDNDPTEQLKNIKELHDQGVLTDEEFEEKKSDLLDKI